MKKIFLGLVISAGLLCPEGLFAGKHNKNNGENVPGKSVPKELPGSVEITDPGAATSSETTPTKKKHNKKHKKSAEVTATSSAISAPGSQSSKVAAASTESTRVVALADRSGSAVNTVTHCAGVVAGLDYPKIARVTGASAAALITYLITSGLVTKIDNLLHLSSLDSEGLFKHCYQAGFQHSDYFRGSICYTINALINLVPNYLPHFLAFIAAMNVYKKINGEPKDKPEKNKK
jgi:hypothetical protein